MPQAEFQKVSDHDTQWMVAGLAWDDVLTFLRRPHSWVERQARRDEVHPPVLPARCVIVLDHDELAASQGGTLMGVDGTAIMLLRGLTPITTEGHSRLDVERLVGIGSRTEGFGMDDDDEGGKIIVTINEATRRVYMHLHLKVARGDSDVDWLSVFAYRAAQTPGFVQDFIRDHGAKLRVQNQNGVQLSSINAQAISVSLAPPDKRRILFERTSGDDMIEGCAIGAGELLQSGSGVRIEFNTLIFKLYPMPPIDG